MNTFRALIAWGVRHTPKDRRHRVVTFDDKFLFKRFEFFHPDEHHDGWYDRMKAWAEEDGEPVPKRPHRPPLWRPFNAFLHCWHSRGILREGFHDHPRWSITICLAGKITEHTPWASRVLTPGSVVFRSFKAIHAFEVAPEHRGKTWTLFVVGRRNHRQNTYAITKR